MVNSLKNKILDLFNSGISCIEISKRLGCSKSVVSYHCSKLIIKVDKYSEEMIKIYQEYYDLGYSITHTAKHFDVCRHTLSKKLIVRKFNKTQVKQKAEKRKYEYRKKVKLQCIEYKGGKCQKCGYNKCVTALEFHHIDPIQKDLMISGGTKSFKTLKTELDKCILVCANCHREIHNGLHPDIYPSPDTR